jgi:hypothetical protein
MPQDPTLQIRSKHIWWFDERTSTIATLDTVQATDWASPTLGPLRWTSDFLNTGIFDEIDGPELIPMGSAREHPFPSTISITYSNHKLTSCQWNWLPQQANNDRVMAIVEIITDNNLFAKH